MLPLMRRGDASSPRNGKLLNHNLKGKRPQQIRKEGVHHLSEDDLVAQLLLLIDKGGWCETRPEDNSGPHLQLIGSEQTSHLSWQTSEKINSSGQILGWPRRFTGTG